MYQYIFSDEDSKIIEQQTQKEDKKKALKDNFEAIDNKYLNTLTGNQEPSLNLEKMTFEKPSDEQIKQQATNSLADYRESGLKNIEQEYMTKSQNIDDSISLKKQNADMQKSELEKKYASLKADASNDALKRGLARSSIVVNTLEAFDNKMLDNFMTINQDLANSIDTLSNQKSLLEQQKQNALNSFDISYAVQLNEKIDKINEKLKQQEETVLKYNNEIAEKEAEYKRKKQQEALDYAEYVGKYGLGTIEMMKSNEKYKLAREYFLTLPKAEAIKELESDSTYINQLGTYYYKLINELKQ